MDYLNTVTINQTRNFIGGKALHPRRCRRAHRGDGVSDGPARFTRGRHTTHVHRMRLLSRPPTSDPHTPPSPTVSETSAIRTCGRHIMRLLSRPPSTVLRSALVLHLLTFVVLGTLLLLGSAFVQYVDRTCFGASLPDMLPLGPESFGVLIGPSSSLFNIG